MAVTSPAATRTAGIEIPVLCHDERYDPVGVCRMCVGGRVYAAACVRPCEDGMVVDTSSAEARPQRRSEQAPEEAPESAPPAQRLSEPA